MDQPEPNKITDESDDDRLIEKRACDGGIDLIDPLWFEYKAHYEEDRN